MNESAPKIEQSQLTPRTTYDKSAPLTEEQQKLAEGGYQQVKDIAFRMFNQGENQTFQLGDFIVWGTDGLLEAARKFDASKNSHFSVYAAGIIRGRILDNIQRERMISRHHFEFLKRREQAIGHHASGYAPLSLFPQHFMHCDEFSKYRRPCAFRECCWAPTVGRDPIGSGLFTKRIPHHAAELANHQGEAK